MSYLFCHLMSIRMSSGKTLLMLATIITTGWTANSIDPACELTESIVSVDCTNIYSKVLSVEDVAPELKIAYNASHLEHGDDCDDKLQITLNLMNAITGEVVPFHSVNIVLKVHTNPKKKNESEDDGSITTYAAFGRGRFGETVNCFKPENSIVLISYEKNKWTSGGEGLNTTTVTIVGVPTDGIVLTFVQFKLSNGSVAQEIIYLENSPSDLESSSGPESEIPDLNDEEEYEEQVLSFFDESTPHPREVRSVSAERQIQRANMSLTALRRGHVRYTGHDDSGPKHRKALHTIESGETDKNFSLLELRRGRHRFHNESSHAMRQLGRGTQQNNGYDLLEIKRGKVRWHPNGAGSRSLRGIHQSSHDSKSSLESLRRGHVRYHASSPEGRKRNINLRSQKSDQATNFTEDALHLIDLRRGHVRQSKVPGMHSRSLINPSGEQREVLGNFRLLDFRRGHRKFAPKSSNSRSVTVHRKFGDTPPNAYNASLVQLRRGPKHLTKQDHLAAKMLASRNLRDASDDDDEASLSFQDSGINAESRKGSRAEARSIVNVKEVSIDNDTNMGENLPEPVEGITKAHVERMGVDYVPKVELIYSGCGKQYSCFHHPKNCHLKKNCLVASSWRTDGTGRIHVVLLARNKHYVAVAFSTDQNMGDDPAVHCKRIPGTDRVAIWKSYNAPGSTPNERLNVVETRNQTDVEPITGAVYQGIITCDFTFPVKMDSDQGDPTDFSKQKVYIFLAIGMNNLEPDGAGSISYHRRSLVSSSSVNLVSSKKTMLTETTHYGNGIHVGFSIIVYTLFMPLAIIMSRYCQEVYQSPLVRQYPVWMVIHVIFQCLAVICNIIIALSAYIGRSGGVYTSGTGAYHAVIGTLITILSIVNLGIGIFVHIKRKSLSEPLGPLQLKLHLAHFIIGHIIFVLGALELIRGPYIPKSRTACGFSVIAGFWLLFYVFANLLLMFNTDYLRRLQKVKEPTSRSFFGPAIHLNLWADKEEFNSRRDILIFMFFLCPLFTVALYATYWMSSNSCTQASVGYIY